MGRGETPQKAKQMSCETADRENVFMKWCSESPFSFEPSIAPIELIGVLAIQSKTGPVLSLPCMQSDLLSSCFAIFPMKLDILVQCIS